MKHQLRSVGNGPVHDYSNRPECEHTRKINEMKFEGIKVRTQYPSDHTKMLFKLCMKNDLLTLPAMRRPSEADRVDEPNYCLYHRMLGHSIEDYYVFKNEIQKLIQSRLITMHEHLVDPPQPHAWDQSRQSANVIHVNAPPPEPEDPEANPWDAHSTNGWEGDHPSASEHRTWSETVQNLERQVQSLRHGQRQTLMYLRTMQESLTTLQQGLQGPAGAPTPRTRPPCGGWISEESSNPSDDEIAGRLYSFPRHRTLALYRTCLRAGLLGCQLPTSVPPNYCIYHQDAGHALEDCHVFKDKVEAWVNQGIIDLGNARVNPPQPHIREWTDHSADVVTHTVNVIDPPEIYTPVAFTFPDPDMTEGGSSGEAPTWWCPEGRIPHRSHLATGNVGEIFEKLLQRGVVMAHTPPPTYTERELNHPIYCRYHAMLLHPTDRCPDVRDWIESLIQKGKIDPEGNSMVLIRAREAAQREFEESDYMRFKNLQAPEADERGWLVPPIRSGRENTSWAAEQAKELTPLKMARALKQEKNMQKNMNKRLKKQAEQAAAMAAPAELTPLQKLQKLIDELEEYIPSEPTWGVPLDRYISWEEMERKTRLKSWLHQMLQRAQEGEKLPLPKELAIFYKEDEITVEKLEEMLKDFSCNMVSIPPPASLQSPADTPPVATYRRRNRGRGKGRGRGKKFTPSLGENPNSPDLGKAIIFRGEEP
ncbi:hypothetical protein Taro_017069 [Colocasia esculenta]|uniref:Uncharacterized protein n=1 Tax=Colocasia esculenta TaxID=4460 RepID=A0A843UM44_COLES|nr:hypothetical protein [Colocasia esculenta]